jgi:DNA polymerase III sliding clamp (beta) subunit (PCNA family)
MKLKITVEDFQRALKAVRDLSPSGSNAESFGVCIEASNSGVIFSAQRSDLIVRLSLSANVIEEGRCTVPVLPLYSAVSSFHPLQDGVGTDLILLTSSEEKHQLSLSAKTYYSSGVKIPHRKVFSLLPNLPIKALPTTNKTFICKNLPAAALTRALSSVSYAASSDKNLQLFSGVYFEVAGNKICLAATDGSCIAESLVDGPTSEGTLKAVLPSDLSSKIIKCFSDGAYVNIYIENGNFLYVETRTLTVGGSLISEPYPIYKDFFPKGEIKFIIDKQLLLDNLTNLSYESTKVEDGRVSFRGIDNLLSLTCGHSENKDIPYEGNAGFCFDVSLKDCVLSIKNLVSRDLIITKDKEEASLIKFTSDKTLLEDHQLTTAMVPLLSL